MTDEGMQRMVEDLSNHAAEDLQKVLNRHTSIAQGVLPPADMTAYLLRIANGVQLGTILYALRMSKDDADAGAIFDLLAGGFQKILEAGRPAVLAKFGELGRAQVHG